MAVLTGASPVAAGVKVAAVATGILAANSSAVSLIMFFIVRSGFLEFEGFLLVAEQRSSKPLFNDSFVLRCKMRCQPCVAAGVQPIGMAHADTRSKPRSSSLRRRPVRCFALNSVKNYHSSETPSQPSASAGIQKGSRRIVMFRGFLHGIAPRRRSDDSNRNRIPNSWVCDW